MSSAASWDGVASPSMTAPIAARASSRDSVRPSTIAASAARTCVAHRRGRRRASAVGTGVGARRRRLAAARPCPRVANEPVAASSRPPRPRRPAAGSSRAGAGPAA